MSEERRTWPKALSPRFSLKPRLGIIAYIERKSNHTEDFARHRWLTSEMSDPAPLVDHIFTADPSAHVFNGKIYVYPSHDRETDIEDNDNGDQYDMNDYHVLSMDTIGGKVTDHGVALKADDIPWVSKQVWAPDCAEKNGKYYFYFPARDQEGIFRIGVAESEKPEGPFKPDPDYIPGSYSIDPACFVDDDGQAYLYFGGRYS